MATYKGIKGVKVVTKTSDPTASEAIGTVWYNSTGNALKYAIEGSGAWAAGGNLNTARRGIMGIGSQTAALGCGGVLMTNAVEAYNGSTWTTVTAMGAARYMACPAGTQTAGLIAGGYNHVDARMDITETYNGSTWTEVNNLNTGRRMMAQSVGTQTAALAVSGGVPVFPNVESWDGTSWSEINDVNTARTNIGGSGTTTAALMFGGGPSATAATESWNGTSWTAVNSLNTARQTGGSAYQATSTSSLFFGGETILAVTEKYDGTSWTEVGDLANGRHGLGGAGTASAGLAFGGIPPTPPNSNATEEWNDPVYAVKTVTVS